MEASLAVIMEMWFKDCPELDADLLDLENGTGILLICKNRAGPGVSLYLLPT